MRVRFFDFLKEIFGFIDFVFGFVNYFLYFLTKLFFISPKNLFGIYNLLANGENGCDGVPPSSSFFALKMDSEVG